MMKLYYSPGACSQSVHIVLHEIGFSHDSIRVDLKSKTLDDGSDYLRINPKGAVPALDLGNGEVLTENAVVLQYLGDRAGTPELFPPLGDFRRYRVLEWLNFIATELHKGFGPLFHPADGEEPRKMAREHVTRKLDYVERALGDGPYLLGERFTLADAYLFVMLGWAKHFRLEAGGSPRLVEYRERIKQRPSVRQVLEFEGLVEKEAAS